MCQALCQVLAGWNALRSKDTPTRMPPATHTHIHSHLSLSSLNNSSPSVNSFKNIPIVFQRAAQSVIGNKEKECEKLKNPMKTLNSRESNKNKVFFLSINSITRKSSEKRIHTYTDFWNKSCGWENRTPAPPHSTRTKLRQDEVKTL